MKMCPNCRNQINDEAVYCPICGTAIDVAPPFQPKQTSQSAPDYNSGSGHAPVYTPPVPYIDPYDHTKDFDPKDISENKVIAMLVYLMGPLGILIALLVSSASKYASFHVRQALKLTVVEILSTFVLAVFILLTSLIRLSGFGIFMSVLVYIAFLVIKIICFLQICKGKAKEAYFVRSLHFLK